jgi:hypothetical protein
MEVLIITKGKYFLKTDHTRLKLMYIVFIMLMLFYECQSCAYPSSKLAAYYNCADKLTICQVCLMEHYNYSLLISWRRFRSSCV